MCARKMDAKRAAKAGEAAGGPADRLTALLERAAGPAFSLDRECRYTGFNPRHAAQMRNLYGADIELGHSMAEYMTVQEDWKSARTAINRALSGESFLESAVFPVETDSRNFSAVVHIPVRDTSGQVSGVTVVSFEVADRRLARNGAWRDTGLSSCAWDESAVDWEYWMRPDGELAYVSPSCEKISGYPAERFRQDPGLLTEIIHPDDRERMALHLATHGDPAATGYFEQDFRLITRQGEERWICHSCRPVFDGAGKFMGRRANHRDITERKTWELTLLTLQQAVTSADASVIITNRKAEIEYVNPKFTEMTGYSFAEARGRTPRFLKGPGTPASTHRELWRTVTAGKTWRGTFQNVRKNGEYYWEAATISPVCNDTGAIIRYVAIKEDITSILRAEQALQESRTNFRQLVERMPLPLAFISRKGDVGYINERFTKTFGYTVQDVPSVKAWWRLAYPEKGYRERVRQKWEDAVASAVRDGQDISSGEYSVTCKAGNVRLVTISGIIIEDNYLVVFSDITEQRRQELLLKATYERNKKNELMNELVLERLPSRKTLADAARMLGMRTVQPINCYLVTIGTFQGKTKEGWGDQPETFQQTVDSLVDELSDDTCLAWESRDGIGVICFDTTEKAPGKEEQLQQAECLRQSVHRMFPDVTVSIGIAEHASGLSEIGVRYQQASVAVKAGRRFWPLAGVYHYLDIGIFQLLPCLRDRQQVDAFIGRTLGGLLQYDGKKQAEYLETLEVIIESDNLKEAAGRLAIHYKTLMFRKQRLESILGCSLDNFSSRMTLAAAVRLMKLGGELEE